MAKYANGGNIQNKKHPLSLPLPSPHSQEKTFLFAFLSLSSLTSFVLFCHTCLLISWHFSINMLFVCCPASKRPGATGCTTACYRLLGLTLCKCPGLTLRSQGAGSPTALQHTLCYKEEEPEDTSSGRRDGQVEAQGPQINPSQAVWVPKGASWTALC